MIPVQKNLFTLVVLLQFLSDSEDEILSKEFSPLPRDPKEGDFVIILIDTQRKKKYYYVARILEKSDDVNYDYYVSYLKLKSKIYHKFVDPIEPDMAGVLTADIKYSILPPKDV